jgi:SAM-dependent methyltransferase
MFRFRHIPTAVDVARDHREYEKSDFPSVPFTLNDEQLLELGRRYYICLMPQNLVLDGFHDDPNEASKNKPWQYLQEIPAGSKVLFVGTGPGREVLAGNAMGFDAYGITMGSNNINFGRQVLGLDSEHFVEGCNELLPFPSEFFDAVAGFQIFEHTISPMMFLLEQSRVLKSGGHIVLEWPPACWHSAGGDHPESPQHHVCFTPGQGRALLMKSGFSNVSLFYKNMTPIPEENWWRGEQEKGYVVAKAQKVESDAKYINTFRQT